MMFQSYALFPHLSCTDNVAFNLKTRGVAKAERRARARDMLDRVRMKSFADRLPAQLSGGQQQRVALARALAPEPQVLLLDEPLSNLDPSLRERTRRELRALIKRVGITTIFVTHEQEEAFALGDRVAVLQAGRLEQVAAPDELYEHPATVFVATFVGRANVVRGKTAHALGAGPGQLLVVRPERLALAHVREVDQLRDLADLIELVPLAARLEKRFEFHRDVEMILDGILTAARHQDDVVDA